MRYVSNKNLSLILNQSIFAQILQETNVFKCLINVNSNLMKNLIKTSLFALIKNSIEQMKQLLSFANH